MTWDSFAAMVCYETTVCVQAGGKVKGVSAANTDKSAWAKKANACLKKAVFNKIKVY